MGQFQIFRHRNYERQVWRNGNGTTFQIAISPEGAALTDFDWRFSIAEIEQDCDFSAFDGYDRTLVLLEGQGLFLKDQEAGPDSKEIHLDAAHPMLSFRGETALRCHLAKGRTVDFNVMTKRGILGHRVEIVRHLSGQKQIDVKSEQAFIFCLGKSLDGESGGQRFHLERHDMLKIEGGPESRIELCAVEEPGFLFISFFD